MTARTDRVLRFVPPEKMSRTSDEEGSEFEDPPSGVEPNLVSSLLDAEDRRHSPVLDIDFEARLIPSSTPGHFHLYLDGLEMDQETYDDLLKALADAGVLSTRYVGFALDRGETVVRREGVTKRVDSNVPTDRHGRALVDMDEPF